VRRVIERKAALLVAAAERAPRASVRTGNRGGRQPTWSEARGVPPSVQGEPSTLEAVVGSSGPGQGEVTVVFTLRDRATGASYREERTVHLGPGERLLVTASVPAPSGDYELHVEALYPPD